MVTEILKGLGYNNNICIIVLTYNNVNVSQLFFKKLFETDKDFSLVIIDNGSSDSTPDYLRSFHRKNTIIGLSDCNMGVIEGRNTGYLLADKHLDFKYVLFLDNDQIVSGEWLEQYLRLISDYDAVGIDAWSMAPSMRPVRSVTKVGDEYAYVGAGGLMIKREVFADIGMFDNRYSPMYFEDPDLCFSLSEKGYKYTCIRNSEISHIGHQTIGKLNIEERRSNFKKSYKKFCKKWNNFIFPIFTL